MEKCCRSLALAVLALTLGACATGPKYAQVKASLPVVAADKGRVYFYRSGTPFGAAIQPAVMLNGEKVGDSQPGGVFYVDRAPGNYEVVLSTEVERKLTFTLDRDQGKYVRMSVGLGVLIYRVYPELADRETAEAEMQDLSFTGTLIQDRAAQGSSSQPNHSTVQLNAGSAKPPAQTPPATAAPQDLTKASPPAGATLDDLKDLMPQK